MKTRIEISVEDLRRRLPGLAKIIRKKAVVRALSCVQIVASGGSVKLIGSSLDSVGTVEVAGAGDGTVLVPLEILNQIACAADLGSSIVVQAGAEEPEIQYLVEGTPLVIPVPFIPSSEYPQAPGIGCLGVEMPDVFQNNLKDALRCVSDDPTRYALRGVLLDVSNTCHTLVATNGRLLYAANSITLPIPKSVILPDHKVWSWKGLLRDGPWRLSFVPGAETDPGWICVQADHWSIAVRPVEGEFPNWRQVTALYEPQARISFGPDAIEFMRTAAKKLPNHDERHQPVALIVRDGKLRIGCKPAGQSLWTTIAVGDATSTGEMAVSLDRRFLVKALEFGFDRIELFDAISPMRFVAPGKQLIVMPLRGDLSAFVEDKVIMPSRDGWNGPSTEKGDQSESLRKAA